MLRKPFMYAILMIAMATPLYPLSAQDILRKEYEVKDPAINYHTKLVDEKGVVIFVYNQKKSSGQKSLDIIHINTDIEEIFTESLLINNDYTLLEVENDHKRVVSLFESQRKQGTYLLIAYDIDKKLVNSFSCTPETSFDARHYCISGDYAFWGGKSKPLGKERLRKTLVSCFFPLQWFGMKKYTPQPVIVSLDLNTGATIEIVKPMTSAFEFLSFQPTETDNSVIVALRINRKKQLPEVLIYTTTSSGEIHPRASFEGDKERELINGRLYAVNIRDIIFCGTYQKTGGKKSKSNQNKSHGLFFARFSEGGDSIISYHDFNNFPNFSNAIKQRYEKRSVLEKGDVKEIDIAYQIFLHNTIKEVDGNFIVVGEAFYPEYEYQPGRGVSPMYYGMNYGYHYYYQPESRWVFKGFRYTHAILAMFNKSGALLWENSISTSNILSMKLEEKANIIEDEEATAMVYAHDGTIHAKIFSADYSSSIQESFEPDLLYPEDKVTVNFSTHIKPWYNNYLLLYGKQEIKNRSGKNRTVFYVSKVAFE